MEKGYRKIFWGIVIASFNLKLGFITIFPAFIGWLLVLSGISNLEEHTPFKRFYKPKISAQILMGASAVGSLMIFTDINTQNTLLLIFYPVLVILIELIMFHHIFEASIYELQGINQIESAKYYIRVDRNYMIYMGIMLVLTMISNGFNHEIIGFLAGVFIIIIRISLLASMSNLRKTYDELESFAKSSEDLGSLV